MSGEPEVMAKTLALAIAIVAQREKRPVCVINYSYDLSFFVLTDLTRQRKQFLSFLSHSYDGGNNENLLFTFIFTHLRKSEKYSRLAETSRGADLLVISDFEWSPLDVEVQSLIEKARAEGMRFCGLGIEVDRSQLERNEPEEIALFVTGETFFKQCDLCYISNDGEINRYFNRTKTK